MPRCRMTLTLFAGNYVRDYDTAADWYSRLLGAGPSFLPNDREAVWELAEDRYVYIELKPERSGHGVLTAFVDDLDARVAGIAERGIEPETVETYENGVRKVVYRDPDGNEFGFAGGPV